MTKPADEQLYRNVLDAVRALNAQRRTPASASSIADILGVTGAPVATALRRGVGAGYLRAVPVYRCSACGSRKPGAGAQPCRSCGVEAPAVPYQTYAATELLMASGPTAVTRPAGTVVLDRLEDVDRAIPLDADRGGVATAAHAAAVELGRLRRGRAAWAAVVVAVVATIAAVAIGIRQIQLATPPLVTLRVVPASDRPARETPAPAPGRAATSRPASLYATADQARAACGAQEVVFANTRSRIWHPQGDSMYGIYRNGPFPQRGFGCADDLAAARYRKSRAF